MANLIVIRLVPVTPVDANTFTGYLKGLTIKAFDLSVNNPQGQEIGAPASYLPTAPNKKPNPKGRIFQHYIMVPQPIPAPPLPTYKSVATAVIEVPAGVVEYLSSDVRLQITRGSETIVDRKIDYNVDWNTTASLPNPNVAPALPAGVRSDFFIGPVSFYLSLPAPPKAGSINAAAVELPTDGTPPAFAQVLGAIEKVLRADPTVTSDGDLRAKLKALSAAQCKHIAYEIVWNRQVLPLPTPPKPLEEMYTSTSTAADPDEQGRKQFEAKLAGYYALNNAGADRLASFVFSAVTAVVCEAMSAKAARAGFTVPLITTASTLTTIPEAGIILSETGGLQPPLLVPAAYFYALGAVLPVQVAASQRYDMARFSREPQLLTDFQTAADAGFIAVPAPPVSLPPGPPAINVSQAARRLTALGSDKGSDPVVALPAPFAAIVTDWLAYAGTSQDVDSQFWAGGTVNVALNLPAAYLDLVLRAVTDDYQPLIDAVKANVDSVGKLVQVTDDQWRAFFLDKPLPIPGPPPPIPFPPRAGTTAPRLVLLPGFTQPGTPPERVEAFIRHLRTFFKVPFSPAQPVVAAVDAAPTLGVSIADVFARFTAAYNAKSTKGPFLFGKNWDFTAFQQAIADPTVLPGDAAAQAWLQQALKTLDALFRITAIGLSELQFSLMEALYARGFTDIASVTALSEADFQEALTGTVAYDHAAAIYAKTGGTGPTTGPTPGGFKPVNPGGSLTDCIPPLHLSPLGPVEYLCEMLQASASSTCENPGTDGQQGTLGALLASRRGALGDLLATRANLETPLPLVDLVNESLEALAAGLPGATGGAVYDTAGDELAGHKLDVHPPQTLFAALPEHSSPATPVARPAAYDKLRAGFTAPGLPYPQALDICRSYLRALGSSRFAAMRHFRKEITELAIDPAHEPADFQRQLWRYPVRFDTALEYLKISQDEYALLFSRDDGVALAALYGSTSDAVIPIVEKVPEFLTRTGLTYCQFLELWRARFVVFNRASQGREGASTDFPECLPCCPDDLRITFVQPQDPLVALRELAVFIRLWRRLQELPGPKITFVELADICTVLGLFNATGAINPDFLRQLAALLMLRDDLRLPLSDRDGQAASGATGADRTHLLALWVGPTAAQWSWAVALLLNRIEDYAEARHGSLCTGPEFLKLIAENLDPLSRLAGFDPATPSDTWHARPANTLRFVEVLSKIYASDFTVGEILFLFTAGDHLDGDDAFPMVEPNEALDDPFDLPDEEEKHGLRALRHKLLCVELEEGEAEEWSWPRIAASLRHELGFAPAAGPDALDALGEHFFPTVLEREGHPGGAASRRFAVGLDPSKTTAAMWNTPPGGPFHFQAIDATHGQLWTRLPLRDAAVATRLSEIRQLGPEEEAAVRDLYFAPRAALAPFALLFANFGEAVGRLVQEEDAEERFAFFRHQFARFHRRCRILAAHLEEHVEAATGQEQPEGAAVAWRVLRSLWADENAALTPWEDDSGKPPAVTWGPQPNGGAFAALLGLAGTGLLAEFSVPGPGGGRTTVWREVHGPLSAFGPERDRHNAPVPCVVPSPALTLTPEQQRFAAVRNGFALRDADGEPLGGGQPFQVRWSGSLLVEHGGRYRFHAGAPTPGDEEPDFEAAEGLAWRLTLQRGQKIWTVLNHRWHRGSSEEAPAAGSAPLHLRPGIYRIVAELEQREPLFRRAEDICPRHCGFAIKYAGPDTGDCVSEIPLSRLFRDTVDGTLSAEIEGLVGEAATSLAGHFTSSLRDIRRTYQRAFKATLLAHRFRLAAKPVHGEDQSELGYLLVHGDEFLGTCYHRLSPTQIGTHHAWLDFNLLPVRDAFHAPSAAVDQRAAPSPQRQAALFDIWERLFDYTVMRRETRSARERPAWLLFYEAAERQPDDPAQLLRHLGVDLRHAPLVLSYFAMPAFYTITAADLEDESWAVRVWHAEKWLRALARHFAASSIGEAQPALWAADDPGVSGAGGISGNQNLTRFVQDGEFENGDPRRYDDVKRLDDGLRERARAALLAYLCGMDRVALPWGTGLHARRPCDLSDLLLQDVEAGLCERASRIEEAVSAVQTFVQRARLGLEPGFPASPAFCQLWEKRFAAFRVWQSCKRREIYRESWIDWDELAAARQSEAFRFLESELRRSTLTVVAPGGLEWWPAQPLPASPSLTLLQAREPAEIQLLSPAREGLGLLGTPERAARPSWLAPVVRAANSSRGGNGGDGGRDGNGGNGNPGGANGGGNDGGQNRGGQPGNSAGGPNLAVRGLAAGTTFPAAPAVDFERLPLWLQAAVRLGTRFLRIAAAGVPPTSTRMVPRETGGESACCACCGGLHPPVMDEYYFWLESCRSFDAVAQDADQGAPSPNNPNNDTTSDWHNPAKLPGLLSWSSKASFHLVWSRWHHGEFQPPRRSNEALVIDPVLLTPGEVPHLTFAGRTADSLRFEVNGGRKPVGYLDPANPGFRYDLATDSAVVLPLVAAPPVPGLSGMPGGLQAYPFFAYFPPGTHLEPPSAFSVALSVAATLRAHCRFEPALKWYELAFNPLQGDNTWAQCPPPSDQNPNPNNPNHPNNPNNPDPARPPAVAVRGATAVGIHGRGDGGNGGVRGDDTPCCPSEPVSDDVARRRAILFHYLETLFTWGDALTCHNTSEAFQQATVIFDTLKRLLGARPATVHARDEGKNPVKISAFVPRPAPLNPRLLALYDRTADRLALLHNCLNGRRRRNGRPDLDMPYWGEWGDRGDASGCGCSTAPACDEDRWLSCCSPCAGEDDGCMDCCKPYRFTYLLQKAMELAGEVRGLGAELLAAYEKGDAEALAALRSTHERQLLELALEVRQNQWRDADWQVQALGKTKEGAQARLRYYTGLIAAGLNSGETSYQSLLGTSMGERAAGNISEAVSQSMGMIPDFWFGGAGIGGSPLAVNQFPIGSKIAAVFAAVARVMNTLGEISSTNASLNLTEGGWDRREQEWRLQVEVIGIEIEQIERQILGAERRRDVALRELNDHQRQIENAVEVQDFLRDKFTNQELYLFLQQETAALYHQGYELARHVATEAQHAFNLERGHTHRTFLPSGAWDDLHEGLMAGERLQLALRQMEVANLDANCREYELTKHISLRLNDPLAFLHLQTTGYCELEIPEWMFDLDYPGHYMRRIKNVTLTLPCVVGPYTGVHCRLTLLSSATRIDPRLAAPSGCCDGGGLEGRYRARPGDPRVVRSYAATEAIATSSGQNDSGLFELSFRDERYLPFELAGAVSRWRLELPPENNQFDLDTLSDVILHLNYTAREGGDVLRREANESAQEHLPGAGLRLFDVRHDFPEAWHRLHRSGGERHGKPGLLPLRFGRERFPFLSGHREVSIRRIELFFELADLAGRASLEVRFLARHEREHGAEEACECGGIDIDCVASGEWPCLYHGVLDLPAGHFDPLDHGREHDLGTLRFPCEAGTVTRAFLVCGYHVVAKKSGGPSSCHDGRGNPERESLAVKNQ